MAASEGKGRKLEAQSSHAESPAKKEARVEVVHVPHEGVDESMGQKEDPLAAINASMSKMMTMMTEMKSDFKKDVSDVKQAVKEARDAAKGAEGKVGVISKEVQDLKEDVRRMEANIDNVSSVAEEAKRRVDALQAAVGGQRGQAVAVKAVAGTASGTHLGKGGKGATKGLTDLNKRSRTLYFGKFPDDTDGDTISDFIRKWTYESKTDFEEIYPIGPVGERGAARFTSEDTMWEFMVQNEGRLQYEAMGKTVYASLDSMHDSNPEKTKSMRKMVRTVIEKHKQGGDGANIKKKMKGTSYSMGRVYFEGERLAEWDDVSGAFTFKGSGKDYEESFRKLMGLE